MADFPGVDHVTITVTGAGFLSQGCRWSLYDPVLDETLIFNPNPKTTTRPHIERSITQTPTTSANGRSVIQEGAAKPQEMTIEGMIYDQTMYEALQDFSTRKYLLLLTDDFEIARYVWVKSLVPTRVRALIKQSGWKHSYTMVMQVVDVD